MLAELGRGGGGVAWVDGEPGIGKSTLVNSVLAGEVRRGIRMFRAVGDELAPVLPLRFLADALLAGDADEFRARLADLLIGRGGGLDAVLAAGEQLVALVEHECARSPVVIVADDLHWADSASLATWHRLSAVARQAPLLLIAVCRPVPQRDEIDRLRQALRGRADAVFIGLGPLDETATVEMAQSLLAAIPGPRLVRALSAAGGNPLYTRELIGSLNNDNLIAVVDGVAEIAADLDLDSRSLSGAIGDRLGFVSVETRRILRAGAVWGVRFSAHDLATMSARPVPALLSSVEEALRAGVLVDDGSELMFRTR